MFWKWCVVCFSTTMTLYIFPTTFVDITKYFPQMSYKFFQIRCVVLFGSFRGLKIDADCIKSFDLFCLTVSYSEFISEKPQGDINTRQCAPWCLGKTCYLQLKQTTFAKWVLQDSFFVHTDSVKIWKWFRPFLFAFSWKNQDYIILLSNDVLHWLSIINIIRSFKVLLNIKT